MLLIKKTSLYQKDTRIRRKKLDSKYNFYLEFKALNSYKYLF
jgi:hypothetical protein